MENKVDIFIDKCLHKFDAKIQMDILEEECAELIKACSKLKRNDMFDSKNYMERRENLIEEMAHVYISSLIVARLCSIDKEDILAEIDKKNKEYGFTDNEI